jgi:autotransporter-associated beta strand protein
MKIENRSGAPLTGLTVVAILLASTAGYVSALSRLFQAPIASQAWESDFQVADGFGLRAQEEKAARQSLAKTAPAWLLNALPGYTSSQARAREAWYFSLDESRNRLGFDFSGSNVNASREGSAVFNSYQFSNLAPGSGFVTSNNGISGSSAPRSPNTPGAPSVPDFPSAPTVTATIAWDGGTTGGGTAWLTNTNWAGDVVPDADDIAQFGSAGASTVIGINLATPPGNNQAVGAIELLGTRNRTIGDSSATSGTLTLNGVTVNGVANTILRNAGSTTLTLQPSQGGAGLMDVALGNATDNIINIDGTGGITISSLIKNGTGSKLTFNGSGGGILLFSGAASNTYTGLTTVNVGELDLGKTAGLNAIAGNLTIGDGVGAANTAIVKLINADQIANTSDVTINSDGVLNLNNNSETFDALNGSSGASILLGSGTLTVGANNENIFTYAGSSTGTGGLTKAGSGILLLSGANNYTGDTTIKAGELFLTASGSLNALSTIRLGDTIPNSPSAMFTFGDTAGGETVANPMIVQASTSGTEGTRTILGLATNGNTNTWTGNITLNTDLVVQSAAAGGSAANGQGILLFTGGVIDVLDNAFIVNTRLRGNTVDTYSVQGIVRVNGVLGSSLATGGSVIKEGSGTLILAGTNNNYTGTNAAALNTSGTEIRGGILGIFGDTSLGLAPATSMNNVFFAPYGVTPTGDSVPPTLRADVDNITLAPTRNVNIASGITARIDSNGNTFTIAGNINGANGNLNKIGPGTLILAGANTYTGTTTISQGVLNASVTGALGGTTGITVNNGGTLMVSGTGNLNRVNDSTPIVLGGGTGANPVFERNGNTVVSEGTGAHRTGPGPTDFTGASSVGLGALSLQSNATFNFGTGGVGTFTFASFAPGTFTLNVLNWTSSNADFTASMSGIDGIDDRLIFAGVLPPDTAFITFNGAQSTALLLEPGFWEVMPLTAVPEPSTWIGGALALAVIGFMSRKRFAKRARA